MIFQALSGFTGIATAITRPQSQIGHKIGMIRKYSTTLHGHRTSFSLEPSFHEELKSIADERGMPVAALIREIDDARGVDGNLSSALRLHVLEWLKKKASAGAIS